MNCRYCNSENVIKYGKYKDTQYYLCKDCGHRFASADRIPKMQNSTKTIADCLNMYYEGMSLAEIRRNLIQQDNNYVTRTSPYNWVQRFTDLAVNEAKKYKSEVGSVWVADETMIDLDGKNVWLWDIIDTKTRFLIATHMSYTRTTKDAQQLMKQAYERTGKVPRIIYTDKLAAYLDGIELTFGADTEHKRGSPFDVSGYSNYIERFHGTLKERTKVMRGLHTIESARRFLDGWLVHYNFFRPHSSLKDMTPAMVAGIRFPFRNWKDIVEQPIEITSRIPIESDSPDVEIPKSKVVRKNRSIKRRPKTNPPMTSLGSIRK
ncbi:IS6 family transposase [Chloroflexota bacterium]